MDMELNGRAVTDVDQIKNLTLVGFGHFTSMRVEGRAGVRGLSLHLERLARDCRQVFDTELDIDRVRQYLRTATADVDTPIILRATVFDPDLTLGKPGAPADPHVLVTISPARPVPMEPLRLQTAVFTRDVAKVKHIGLFGADLTRATAQRNGFDDVLFVGADGTVSEAATANFGLIRDDRLIWPKADVLAGTTMRLISQVRDEEVLTETVALTDLPDFQAAIATNVAVGVRVVAAVDETIWRTDHPMVDALRADYESIPPERL